MLTVLQGDCREVLKALPDASVDSCVTDPPYELGFMGKAWDKTGVAYDPATWREVFRLLKPGGHLLAFGGTRTFHRMACAIEDAGFEIRDQIGWAYGSGFPKSLDVSKALDREAGAEREVIANGKPVKRMIPGADQNATGSWIKDDGREFVPTTTAPATEAAKRWDGWGTALKPAWEPICVARKPLVGTVADNVQQHGTGALNIDACRVDGTGAKKWAGPRGGIWKTDADADADLIDNPLGRWPANLIHDGSDEVVALFPETTSNSGNLTHKKGVQNVAFGKFNSCPTTGISDSGSARFFYCAKVSPSERGDSDHPTMKPLALMRYLVRLVTPPGGKVLDPFAGSGSTGVAAIEEGFRAVLCEIDAGRLSLIDRRCDTTPGLPL